MFINTHYERKKNPPHPGGGGSKVDRAGYISGQKRIENLMNAGARLVQSRREMYDFPDGEVDEDFYDPTRNKNYDLADGTQQMMAAEGRLKAAKIRRDSEKIASESAQEASGEALKTEKAPE